MTIAEEMRRAFELASMRRQAQTLSTARQWAKANAIVQRAAALRQKEQQLHRQRYDARLEAAMKRLIDEAGRPGARPVPPGPGLDRFNAVSLKIQAARDVRRAHEARLMKIDAGEQTHLRELVGVSAKENRMRGVARDAFSRAAHPIGLQQRKRDGPGD